MIASHRDCWGVRYQAVLYVVRAESHTEAKTILRRVFRDSVDDSRFLGRATDVRCPHGVFWTHQCRDCEQEEAGETMAEREEEKRDGLRGLLVDAMLLLGASHGISENFDARAEAFYRDTGVMAPGKSEPLEMAGQYTHEQRQELYRAWVETKTGELRDAFAALAETQAATGEKK